jgi:hypothetical protein
MESPFHGTRGRNAHCALTGRARSRWRECSTYPHRDRAGRAACAHQDSSPGPTKPLAGGALATAETRPIIRRSRVVLAAIVVALLTLAAWVLWRPVVHKAARPSASATTAVEATPPPAAAAVPVAPGPALAEPTPIRAAMPANKSAEPAEGRGRAARNKIGKSREAGEPSDRTKNSQSPGANRASRAGKW